MSDMGLQVLNEFIRDRSLHLSHLNLLLELSRVCKDCESNGQTANVICDMARERGVKPTALVKEWMAQTNEMFMVWAMCGELEQRERAQLNTKES